MESPAAGTDTIALAASPESAAWSATANAAWLHLASGFANGTGSTNIVFTFDVNPGATRTGTLTIASETLTVTQAGTNHIASSLVTTLVSAGLSSPTCLAVDGAGNIFIADRNNNAIKKWTSANNSVSTVVAAGLNLPFAVAVDAAGNLYIVDSGNHAIKKWTATNNIVTTLVSTGLNNPCGVAVDADGNVFIADTDNHAIKRLSLGDTNVVTLVSSGLNRPFGIATDIAGNVFIADFLNNAIKKWTAASSNVTTLIPSGLNQPVGVAVDGAGNVYVANVLGQNIRKWTAANGLSSTLLSGLLSPNGVAVDGAGNIFFTSTVNNNIRELPRAFVDTTTRFETAVGGSDVLQIALPSSVNLLTPFAPTSSQPWLTLGATSNGSVTINFTNNFGNARTANLTVLGLIVPITQAAPAFVLATNSANVGAAPGTNSVSLTTSPEGAAWTATNNATWLHLASGFTNGAGSTNIVYSFDANPGAQRVGTLTIAGQTFTVTQAAPPLPEIGVELPAGVNLVDGSATNNFGNGYVGFTNTISTFVITNSGTTNLAGIAITKDGVNAGDFIVTAIGNTTLAPNASTTFTVSFIPTAAGNRTAAIHIASSDADENPFDIALTGFAIAPSNTLSTASLSVSFIAGSSSISLTVTPEIANWTATANAAWLHLSAANQSGTGSTNITLTFDANPGAQRFGTLTIAGQTLTVTQAALPVPEIGVQQPLGADLIDGSATNNFANGYIGFTNTINTFVITNSGTTNLTGLAITKDGANAADFIVSTIGSATLAPNASAAFTVSFIPTAAGNRAAAIHIASNDTVENPFDIALTGFAIAPSNTLSATAHFVSYLAGSSNVTLTVTPEIATWTASTNASWLQLSPPNQSGTGSTNITYTFSSNSGNQRVGTLTIGGQTLTVTQAALPLQEIGIQQPAGTELADNASIRDFGLGIVNLTNQTKTFVITNSGTTNLTGLAITKSGANTGDFIVSNPGSVTLPANSSTTFTVSFAPAAAGNRSASLHIASNDADENPFDIALTGIGPIPSFTLAASNRVVGPTAGADSIVLAVTPNIATWTATANSPWLHLNSTNSSGTGSGNVVFTFDANPGATRSGTVTIAGQVLMVTQAGVNYVGLGSTTTLLTTNIPYTFRIAVDTAGNVFFPETATHSIKKWNATNGNVSTVIGFGLNSPYSVAVDTSGNLYIADTGNGAIKKWTATNGLLTTIVSAGVNSPSDIAVDKSGNIYIADSLDTTNTFNNAIKKWTAASNTLTTLISTIGEVRGVALDAADNVYFTGYPLGKWNAADNTITTITTSPGYGISVDASGNVFFAAVSPINGIYMWSAASNEVVTLTSDFGHEAFGVAVDSSGFVHIAATADNAIKSLPRAWIDPSPKFVNFSAGSDVLPVILPSTSNLRGPFAPTSNQPWLTFGSITNGVITFNFTANTTPSNRVATISVLGQTISVTQAGAPFNSALGTTNIVAGPAAGTDSVVLFIQPVTSPNWTATANSSWLHLTAPNQSGNSSANVIFTFDANTGATRTGTLTIAGQTLFVTQGGTNVLSAGTLTTLAASGFNQPKGVAADSAGNLYIADTSNNSIKKWTRTNNTVTTLITGLNQPSGVAVDTAGNVYIADSQNFAIKKWTASNAVVTTIVSSGLNRPAGVAVDAAGNLYIADTYNNAIKKWTATNNTVTTLVTGLDLPNGVAVDAAGNVYIADTFFNRIKKWTAANQTVSIMISLGLIQPHGVAVDASGNIYVTDTFNHAIKKWTVTSGAVTTLISGLNLPKGIVADESGNVFVADTSNNQIKQLPRAFVDTSPRVFNTPASTNSIAAVLPTSANLFPPFAPTSSQAWLTINSASDGMINFAITANTGASRAANLSVFNRTIPITQTLTVTPPTLGYSKFGSGLALNFAANPGQLYQIESAPAVTGPWTTNTSLTGLASGLLSYTNPISTVSNRFFRTRTP